MASFLLSPKIHEFSRLDFAATVNADSSEGTPNQKDHPRPIPNMPSQLFVSLAQSQLEFLAHALPMNGSSGSDSNSKIKSMALYLPQENINTGQLEFLPAVLYPHPSTERVFIAPDASSGMAPALPKTLTTLPGFAHASSLLPGYPMVSSSGEGASAGVGEVEEVMCDPRTKNTALSVPLFTGSQTDGVLLVWPSTSVGDEGASWTESDKDQVSRAAQSLSCALSMDRERSALQVRSDHFRESLSDSLHQVKNPLQALSVYGKLLQRQIAKTDGDEDEDDPESRFEMGGTPQLLTLVKRLMVQSDRVADLLTPMDTLVSDNSSTPLYLMPSVEPRQSALTRWETEPQAHQKETESSSFINKPATMEFSRSPVSKPVEKSPSSSPSAPQVSKGVAMQMSFVPDVLEPIFSGFEAIATEHDIEFQVLETEELPGVSVCPKSLQEAVANVVDNAFKYAVLSKVSGRKNICPRVRVRLLSNRKPLAPGVTIVVEDNGPGICVEDGGLVFQRGFRASSTSTAVEGSGIGLDISRSLVESMGGILEVIESDGVSPYDGAALKFILFRNPDMTNS